MRMQDSEGPLGLETEERTEGKVVEMVGEKDSCI